MSERDGDLGVSFPCARTLTITVILIQIAKIEKSFREMKGILQVCVGS